MLLKLPFSQFVFVSYSNLTCCNFSF